MSNAWNNINSSGENSNYKSILILIIKKSRFFEKKSLDKPPETLFDWKQKKIAFKSITKR